MRRPLADEIRPQTLDEVVGQKHLLGEGAVLRRLIESGSSVNMVFYGPPGTGKTTVANLIAQRTNKTLHRLNATTASLQDIKDIIADVGTLLAPGGILLYLDEIQYFNKKQQQSLLEFMENGQLTLIAATTENPYFYVYGALLSRSTVFEFKPITADEALKGVKATILMKDGKTTAESEITWTEVPAAADTYGNSVVAKGVTKNGNLPVEVVVTSTTTINKVAEVPQITVERDAKADTVTGQLPKKVTVTYSDGHTDEAAVTWNTDGLDKHLAAVGEYTIEGSVEGTTLKSICKLVVETPASEIPVRPATFAPVEVFEASSAADVLKALPKKVSVMMKDDSQEDYDVDWENVPALDWGADDVTVGGKVRGTELTVSCMVRVKPRPAAKGLVIVDQNGKATTAETVLKVERGKEIDLAAAASNAADGALLRGAVTWVSSDPTIATVENGKVKALKNGTVVITATMPVDGDAAAIATLAEDGAAETPAPQQLTASVTVEVVEPAVVQKPTSGKDNGAKPDTKDPSGKKNGKKAAKGSLAETGDNTAVAVAALGGTGLLALIAAAIEKLRHRAE